MIKCETGLRLTYALVAGFVVGCAQTVPMDSKKSGAEVDRREENPARPQTARLFPEKKFPPPGDLERMLDANPLRLQAANQPASKVTGVVPVANESAPNQGKGRFHIQISAETDFDIAQEKKQEYEKKLGGGVDVIFDAPYYKLRWGSFDTRQEAEDKLLDISDAKVQGFVVKQ